MDLSTDKITIKAYPVNFAEVAQFLNYVNVPPSFPSLYSESYFHWKICSNPWPDSACYLLYDAEVMVEFNQKQAEAGAMAHCSITAKPLNPHLNAGSVAGELGDNHTPPQFRGRGHFIYLISQITSAFNANHERLVYGCPAPQIVPIITRYCQFEQFPGLNLVALERPAARQKLRSLLQFGLAQISWRCRASAVKLCRCRTDAATLAAMDQLWALAGVNQNHLLQKDAAWWQWRYGESTEAYQTYGWRSRVSQRLLGYLVVKCCRSSIYRELQICDIVAETPEWAAEVLNLFMQRLTSPLDRIFIWVQMGTPLAQAALEHGFVAQQEVPVIFAQNSAYGRLRQGATPPILALGDTDSV